MDKFTGKLYKIKQSRPVADFIYRTVAEHLESGSVLWLLSGGSVVPIEVQVAEKLGQLSYLGRLTVGLIDERYGPPGHPESNWQKLQSAGFKLDGATLEPVLKGSNLNPTAVEFNQFLSDNLKSADYALGILGLGKDGHTAGLLPGSPALTDKHLASAYQGADFSRLTITPSGLEALDEAILYSVGAEKHSALKMLVQQDLDISRQPAQGLKKVPRLTIFNDLMGENL